MKDKEMCILVKVVDNDFNKQLKGRKARIGQFINFPVRALIGVPIAELKNGDIVRIDLKQIGLKLKALDTEFLKAPTIQEPRVVLVSD